MKVGDLRHWRAAGLVKVLHVGEALAYVEVISASGTTTALVGERFHLTTAAVAGMPTITSDE